jgi:hypothetical protein
MCLQAFPAVLSHISRERRMHWGSLQHRIIAVKLPLLKIASWVASLLQ